MSIPVAVSLEGGVRHPKIYAYTIPEYDSIPWRGKREGSGLIKVGDTNRDVHQRIREQLAGVKMPTETPYTLFVSESAITNEGQVFRDHSVHEALTRAGVHRIRGEAGELTEWFECSPAEVTAAIQAVKSGKSAPSSLKPRVFFPIRPEQEQAVDITATHFRARADPENPPHFLWNAKMRFGKTFTTYQLAKQLGWSRVLVLTYKPAVEDSWRTDLETHVDFEGWRFKGKDDEVPDLADPAPLVWFASFQDVLGTDGEGNPKPKNENLYVVDWDVVVIDEYHFGAWRDAARSLYLSEPKEGLYGDSSERDAVETPDLEEDFATNLEETLDLSIGHYLYLSGTPFRALAHGEFLEDEVFNWTYSDEQREKERHSSRVENPYAPLPKMHLLVYEMPDELKTVALNNFSEFSLTEFFKTEKRLDGNDHFVHEKAVQKWLSLLRGQDLEGLWTNIANQQAPPLPYENPNLLRALQHTIWYMPSVAACHAMKDLLEAPHNTYFHEYAVHAAAGPKAFIGQKALGPVLDKIGGVPQDTKTITLTCGKLLTGVTVPAWTGIFMLRELKSPESYFQAAFRVQSPWTSKVADPEVGGETQLIHKEYCYVFDFSPNRALRQIVDYATSLRSEAASERDDEAAIAEFMEFLPVLSFEGFAMKQMQASDVLDFLTSGTTATMLARRWNSPDLLKLDLRAMEAILNNEELLKSLESIETFRNIGNDLTAIISTNTELRTKTLAKEPLTDEEKDRKKKTAKRRGALKEKLQRFIARIPAFMYLTDHRERAVRDIIERVEPGLFEDVTGLSLRDFELLIDAGVFNDDKMNNAVWKFRNFEQPSLRYGDLSVLPEEVGGWSISRDERFAELISREVLRPGDTLIGTDGFTAEATITEDYGIAVEGTRFVSPDQAASVVTDGGVTDGWSYWKVQDADALRSLDELLALISS